MRNCTQESSHGLLKKLTSIHFFEYSFRRRRAFVLPLVLLTLMLLAQFVFSLSKSMLDAAQQAMRDVHLAQAEEAAWSGVTAARHLLHEHPAHRIDSAALSQLWQDEIGNVQDPTTFYALLAPPWSPEALGVEDESSKLAINALPLSAADEERSREMLGSIPGLTPQVCDAILDWLDADDMPRSFGAEKSYYSAKRLPGPKNGRIQYLDELLHVRGVTPQLLYGSAASPASTREPQTSIEQWGLQLYLSVNGRESNLQRTGQPRIWLNDPDCARIYDLLRPTLGAEKALFIACVRRFGPVDQAALDKQAEDEEARTEGSAERIRDQLGTLEDANNNSSAAQRGENTEREGVELSGDPGFDFRSVFDLCGGTVQVRKGDQEIVLQSPWKDDFEGFSAVFKEIGDLVSPFGTEFVEGRVNPWGAPWQVLASIPDLGAQRAKHIAARCNELARRSRATFPEAEFHVTWLLEEGILSSNEFKEFSPYFTPRGDVFRIRTVGTSVKRTCVFYLDGFLDIGTGDFEQHGMFWGVPEELQDKWKHILCVRL